MVASNLDLQSLAEDLRAEFDSADAAHKQHGAALDRLREKIARLELAIEASAPGKKVKSKPAGERQALFYCAIFCAAGMAAAKESDVRHWLGVLRLGEDEFAFGTLWASAKSRLGEDFIRDDDGSCTLTPLGLAGIRRHLDAIKNIPAARFAELSAK